MLDSFVLSANAVIYPFIYNGRADYMFNTSTKI